LSFTSYLLAYHQQRCESHDVVSKQLSTGSYTHSSPSNHFFFSCTHTHSHHQHLTSHWYNMKGISRTALQWFKSYHTNRSFRVSWGGHPTSLFHLHVITRICHSETWFFLLQLYPSFQPDDPTVDVHISACLTDISCWMKDHQLQLNLTKACGLDQGSTSSQLLNSAGFIHHNSIGVPSLADLPYHNIRRIKPFLS